jgi:hypothetical protein
MNERLREDIESWRKRPVPPPDDELQGWSPLPDPDAWITWCGVMAAMIIVAAFALKILWE